MIVSQCELLPALVHEIEYQFRILAVLVRQYILALEHGRIETASAVGREHVFDDPLDVLSAEHLGGSIIPRALENDACNGPSWINYGGESNSGLTLAVLSSSRSFFFPSLLSLDPAAPAVASAFPIAASVFFSSPSLFLAASSAVGSVFDSRSSLTRVVWCVISAASDWAVAIARVGWWKDTKRVGDR